MIEIQQILENSKLTAETIEANLMHPVLRTSNYKKREIFEEITSIADNFYSGNTIRMIGLAGLRGLGKTTLLWQTAEYMYKNHTENIYFFHLGRLKNYNIGIKELHEGIEKYLANGKLWTYKEKIVLLFDEVHEDPNWAKDLKILYDMFPIAFAVATGSSALLLQSTADLVTRMLIQHVYPLNFCEYINFTHSDIKNISELRYNVQGFLFSSENATTLFNKLTDTQKDLDRYIKQIDNTEERIYDYIVYHNIIRFLLNDRLQVNSLIYDLVQRIIIEDIPKINTNANLQYAEKIINRLAASDEINLQSLSQTIGIPQDTISENLNILEKAELINLLHPYGGIDSKINKAKKYFFISPSIRKAIITPLKTKDVDDSLYAKMLEDIVVLYLKRIFRDRNTISFSSAKGQKNPDLIIETIDNPILLEIGINKNNLSQISKSKIKYRYGIIINSKTNQIELHENTVIVPLKYFLLL